MRKYTPSNITELKLNQVFVFGSNMNGNHYGGAARLAYDKFGATWGVSEGVSGQTYAIPTLDVNMQPVMPSVLIKSFIEFLTFVDTHPEKEFLLTKVGCGIAGYDVEDVRTLFKVACMEMYWKYPKTFGKNYIPDNLIIPKEFDWAQSFIEEVRKAAMEYLEKQRQLDDRGDDMYG